MQDVAKRLIASLRRWPEPPAPGWNGPYKARSGPPLPFATFCTQMHRLTSLPPDGQQRFGLQIPDHAVSVVGLPAPLERVDRLSTARRRSAPRSSTGSEISGLITRLILAADAGDC